ncbi:high light inducible protein [Cyanobium sp. NIES-981]|uniref:high light inducible protein n=1 Tax=Cyanobium sp. NIES-981 TaxID=1851505 RepID=UPI0007DD78C6|nr:high light inducible protein [Cyanobium sp. NIES-981]SBO42978.1 putative high light inducible protein [Cyanobium sp. NIES-981]
MASADPDTASDSAAEPAAGSPSHEPVSPDELNAWRRGFTPQAEIWNGRLAMLGLSVGLTVLVLARLAFH